MAEPSLGEGIGLQQGVNRDDYWAKQIYARGVEKKAAREKADEDLIKEADFKKDYSKFLPMYANKIAEIQQGVLQKVALARQANKNTARSVVAKDLYQAQLEVGKLEQDNARAMDYVKNDKITKEPTVIEALVNPNGQVSDLADFNDGQFFMTDATGTFAYRPYKEPDLASKVKYDGKYNKAGYPTGKYEIRGNQRYQELKSGYDQTAVNAEALQLAQTDDFRQKVAYDTRLWKPDPNETQDAFIKRKLEYADKLALETAAKMKGVDVLEMRPTAIPQGNAGDKKDEPVSILSRASYSVPKTILDPKTKTPVETNVAVVIPLGDKNIKPLPISNSNDVFEVETNDRINKGKPVNLQFTPQSLEYKMITKDGKKERKWYAAGVGVDIAGEQSMPKSEDFTDKKEYAIAMKKWKDGKGVKEGSKQTTFNLMIPLEQVKGQLTDYYKLSELKSVEDEFYRRSGGKEKPSGLTSAGASSNDYIDSILDFEDRKGYKNYGFTSYVGNLTKSQAKSKFKNEYEPLISDLPSPLKATAGDFAFNSEDPRASLLIAAGKLTPSEKSKLYTNGKLDKSKVDNLWKSKDGLKVIKLEYNKNPSEFLDKFDAERLRSYKNTNGADVKYDEWAERVSESRKVADMMLSNSVAPSTGASKNNTVGKKPEL